MHIRAKGCCLGVVVINVCFDVNEETDQLLLVNPRRMREGLL